nr:peptidoglycan DD-metalloendopeptidase family protein [Azospirillum oleiclasticum]
MCAAGLVGLLTQSVPVDVQAASDRPAGPTIKRQGPAPKASPAPTTKAEPAPEPERHTLAVARGDTLMTLLSDADVPRDDAHSAIEALRERFDPRSLQVGQEVTVLFEPRRGGSKRFVGLEIAPDVVRSVSVARGDDGFETSENEKAVRRLPAAGLGEIQSSLFEAGSKAGVPISVMMAVIKAYSHEVDFQRDLQPGDRFAVLYERIVTEDGRDAGEGELLHATLVLSGRELPIYRFKDHDGRVDYYNRQGESIRRALLRTPVDGVRITSGFGMRKHPILGYSKMHKGVDFGAPTGTPIYAAGNGVVEEAGAKGAYGQYVRIRHNNEISTAYAHLSRFANGLRRGAKVEQGEVIAYVGSTGRSTGPHLHYEVLKRGQQIDPRSIDLPTGQKLDGRDLRDFQQAVRSIERQFEQARGGLQLVTGNGAADRVVRKPTDACAAKAGC